MQCREWDRRSAELVEREQVEFSATVTLYGVMGRSGRQNPTKHSRIEWWKTVETVGQDTERKICQRKVPEIYFKVPLKSLPASQCPHLMANLPRKEEKESPPDKEKFLVTPSHISSY